MDEEQGGANANKREDAVDEENPCNIIHRRANLANFMAEDNEFLIFPRFEELHIFNILTQKQELGRLQEKLHNLSPEDVDEKLSLATKIQKAVKNYGQ
jgi:hypothetical protein